MSDRDERIIPIAPAIRKREIEMIDRARREFARQEAADIEKRLIERQKAGSPPPRIIVPTD